MLETGPLRLDKDAVELARRIVHLDLDLTLLADRRVETEIRLFAEAFDPEFEKLAQRLVCVEPDQDQDVLAKRRGELAEASVL